MKIREYRDKAEISIMELAKESGLHLNTVYKYESGKTVPPLDNAMKISVVLGNLLNIDPAQIIADWAMECQPA